MRSQPVGCGLQTGIPQPVGVLLVNGFRVSFEQAVQSERLVNLIKMVHEVIVPDNLAKAAAAAPDQTIVLAETEGQAGGAEQGVGRVQHVGENAGASPGIEANAIFRVSPLSARRRRNTGRGEAVELGASLSRQGVKAGTHVLVVAAA